MSRRRPPTRLLLVGLGARGRAWLTRLQRHNRVELAGIVDPAPEVSAFAARLVVPVWETLEEGLARAGAGAALVASPPWLHIEHTIACMRAGAAVLVEKPFALDTASAALAAEEAARLQLPLIVCQNFRWLKRERALRRVLSSGSVGDVITGVVTSTRSAVAIPHYSAKLKHGALWDFAIHHIDAFRTRFGSTPDRVVATNSRAGASDLLSVELIFDGGPVLHYEHVESAAGYHYHERLDCERGAVTVMDQRVTQYPNGRRPRPVLRAGRFDPDGVVLESFLSALVGDDQSDMSGADNVWTIATVEAIARSIEEGRAVEPAGLYSRSHGRAQMDQ